MSDTPTTPSQRTAGPPVRLIAVALFILTLAVFARSVANGFIDLDDPRYVTQNNHVLGGISPQDLRWALSTYYAGNWHPLTWMSLQFDAQLHGFDARVFHSTNLLLHAASAGLLFLVLWRMTGAVWRSALVAALFAVHPLHVESVAWVSERKDVLSGFFFMLTLLAYANYVEQPAIWRYTLVFLAFGLGLAAKPMLVTVPCVLLLLDYWPLRRLRGWTSVREKVPLFAVAALACLLTWRAQRSNEAVMSLARVPLEARLENALVSYLAYLIKTVWPIKLAAFYPLSRDPRPVWQAAAAVALLVAVTGLVVRIRTRFPYALMGWLWYIGTLVPVIGIVQVGSQALADRYTYLPLIGIFIIASWGLADISGLRWLVMSAFASAAVAACVALSWTQVGYWKDSDTLWQHALYVDPGNPLAHESLGASLDAHGRFAEAAAHYEETLRLSPDNPRTHNALGAAFARLGKKHEALAQYRQALRLDPENAPAHYNLGLILEEQGHTEAAATHYRAALRTAPHYARAAFALAGIAWKLATDGGHAVEDPAKAVELAQLASAALGNKDPRLLEVLAAAQANAGDFAQAVATIQRALTLAKDPRYGKALAEQLHLYREHRTRRHPSVAPRKADGEMP